MCIITWLNIFIHYQHHTCASFPAEKKNATLPRYVHTKVSLLAPLVRRGNLSIITSPKNVHHTQSQTCVSLSAPRMCINSNPKICITDIPKNLHQYQPQRNAIITSPLPSGVQKESADQSFSEQGDISNWSDSSVQYPTIMYSTVHTHIHTDTSIPWLGLYSVFL